MGRDSSIFYRSFYEAGKTLPPKDRAIYYDAVLDGLLNFNIKPPEEMPERTRGIWHMVVPQIMAIIKKFQDGTKGAGHGVKGGAPMGNLNAQKNDVDNFKKQPHNNPSGDKKTLSTTTPKYLDDDEERFITPKLNNSNAHEDYQFKFNHIWGLINDYGERFGFYSENFNRDRLVEASKGIIQNLDLFEIRRLDMNDLINLKEKWESSQDKINPHAYFKKCYQTMVKEKIQN